MLSYSIGDFLAYDKSIWLGMVARYMADWWWFGALASILLVVGVAWWLAPRAAATPKLVFLLLSVCWAWVAWRFHWYEHRSLNWAAGYWALGFAIQAGLLAVASMLTSTKFEPSGMGQTEPGGRASLLLVCVAVAAAFLGPALVGWWVDATPLFGFEWFGLTPDATALMTLILLGLWREGRLWTRVALLVIPVVSLTVSALFSHSLEIISTAIFVGVGLVVVVGLFAVSGQSSSRVRAAS